MTERVNFDEVAGAEVLDMLTWALDFGGLNCRQTLALVSAKTLINSLMKQAAQGSQTA